MKLAYFRSMKQNIKRTGTVELTAAEFRGILDSFAKKKKGLILEAVGDHMNREHNLTVKKVQYAEDLGSVVCVVEGQEGDDPIKLIGKEAEKRNGKTGYRKRFLGFFRHTRDILDEFKKKGTKSVSFPTFMHELTSVPGFEKIEPWRVQTYLHDDRQLKGIEYDHAKGMIRL